MSARASHPLSHLGLSARGGRDPLLLGLALLGGSVSASLLFLWVEVQRPLQRLEQALSQVGLAARPAPLAALGTGAVRRLTGRFNAMVQRLDLSERERATMLAGIAHDLKSPITRLRFRLSLAGLPGVDLRQAEADLAALERITQQFLLFAGGNDNEAAVAVPLDQLLAEVAAGLDADTLALAKRAIALAELDGRESRVASTLSVPKVRARATGSLMMSLTMKAARGSRAGMAASAGAGAGGTSFAPPSVKKRRAPFTV